MGHDEEEELEDGFKGEGAIGDEVLEMPDEIFDYDEEDPDKDK